MRFFYGRESLHHRRPDSHRTDHGISWPRAEPHYTRRPSGASTTRRAMDEFTHTCTDQLHKLGKRGWSTRKRGCGSSERALDERRCRAQRVECRQARWARRERRLRRCMSRATSAAMSKAPNDACSQALGARPAVEGTQLPHSCDVGRQQLCEDPRRQCSVFAWMCSSRARRGAR